MEIPLKSVMLFASIFLTGLSAGFFYAWQVSVIPGTKNVADLTYLETMQSINRSILNPTFFVVFFGAPIILSVATIYQYHTSPFVFGLILAATIIYLIGTFGVTAFGNVPLNNELDILNTSEMLPQSVSEFRTYYEHHWNRLHLIRTVSSVLSFLLALAALLMQTQRI